MRHRVTVVVISIVTMAVITSTTMFCCSAEEAYDGPGGKRKKLIWKKLSNAQRDPHYLINEIIKQLIFFFYNNPQVIYITPVQ